MKMIKIGALALLMSTSAVQADVFDDINYWVGTGANQAALQIDWNLDNGETFSILYGYRWDGAATGLQMVVDIVSADPRLYMMISSTTSQGAFTEALGFHESGDGNFQLSPALSFDANGIVITTGYNNDWGREPVAAGDYWLEGEWPYWMYFTGTVEPTEIDWKMSQYGGVGARPLHNGDADAWVWSDFTKTPSTDPIYISPVPEPTSWALMAGGAGLLLFWQRKRSRAAVA